MNILQQIHTILEDRGNGPTVHIMLTQKQATDLYESLHRIIALNTNVKDDILDYFKNINHFYNDCTRYDTLKSMLDRFI